MLWQIGPLTLDTFPMEVGETQRETTADVARHAVIGGIQPAEFAGYGGKLSLSGQILPFHLGGLSELETAHSLVEAGDPVFVMRGDGLILDYYQLMSVKDTGTMIGPGGVGFVVKYEMSLERVPDPGGDVGASAIETLLSLFG